MRICDAHLHYGRAGELKPIAMGSSLRQQFPCYNIVQFDRMDNYESRLAEHHVEKSVLVPFVFRELDPLWENLMVINYAKRHPGKYFPYALLDDSDPAFLDQHCSEIVGVKQHIVLHDTELTQARKDICARMQEYGLIFLLHTHSDKRIGYVMEIVKNFPKLKIQIAHMGRDKSGGVPFILQVLEAMSPFENVFFDTSTVRVPEVVTKAVEMISAERILYGSDFPFFIDPAGREDIMEEQIQHVLRAGLTETHQEMIFSGNFERLVTLGKM